MDGAGSRWKAWHWAAIIGFASLIAAARAGSPVETDPYWQIRAGLENLEGLPLARPDSWSWAPVAGLFYQNSPGWNDVLAISWRAAGYMGLFISAWLSIMAYFAVVIWLARLLQARAMPTFWVLVAFSLLFGSGLSARATLPAQSLLLLGIGLGYQWIRCARNRSAMLTIAVMMLMGVGLSFIGNWTHLSWLLLGMAVGFAWTLIAMSQDEIAIAVRIAISAAGFGGLLLGLVIGPYGVAAIAQSMRTENAAQGLVLEWVSVFDSSSRWPWVALALVVWAVVLSSSLQLWRSWNFKARVPAFSLFFSLTFVAGVLSLGGLLALRFTLAAALCLVPVAARIVSDWASRRQSRRLPHKLAVDADESGRRISLENAAQIVCICAVGFLIAPASIHLALNLAKPATADAVALLPDQCNLLSTARLSNTVLLSRPNIRVWSDGRMDYYGRERVQDTLRYFLVQPADGIVRDRVPPGTTCVLLPDPDGAEIPSFGTSWEGQTALAAFLDADQDWKRLGSISGFAVWEVKRGTSR